MHYLLYVSSATQHFSEEDLKTLLIGCRQNNAKLDITGMLLCSDNNFIQVLEGEQDTINSLYLKITTDPRHTGCIKLLKGEIQARNFPEWSMGFKRISNEDYSMLAGYKNLEGLNLQATSTSTQPNVLLLLKNFLKINSRHPV